MRIEENGPVQWQDVHMWLPVSYGHGPLNASYLAIHETAEPNATAADHIHHWTFNDSKYAVHYVTDWESDTVYRAVPDDRLAYHVGSGNCYCVGIELCHATNRDDFEHVWANAVEFAAWYLNMRGWGLDHLISHNDATNRWGGSDHTDPIDYFEDFGKSWGQFKQEVADAMERQPEPEQEKREKVQFVYNGGGDVYRLYNPNSGMHHYTLSDGERAALTEAGWNDEGVAWKAPKSAEIPVYRMYNPGNGDHFYTQDFATCESLQEQGWKPEGVPFFTNRDGAPVFRLYNPNSGEHFYTASEGESDNLRNAGWDYEGVAFNCI